MGTCRTLVAYQVVADVCLQGCFPSHLIFFLRHSSQALVTLRRFCKGAEERGGCDAEIGDVCRQCADWDGLLESSSTVSTSKDSGDERPGLPDAIAIDNASWPYIGSAIVRPDNDSVLLKRKTGKLAVCDPYLQYIWSPSVDNE